MEKFNKENYREIAEKVESGEYFNDARNWYMRKYIYNFIERTYILVILFCLVFLIYMVNVYKQAIQPIRKSLPIQVNISDSADFNTRITYLGNAEKNFDINKVFIKYFSERFTEAIESYDYRKDFKKLKTNKNIIEGLANAEILGYYLDKISIRNDDSLIMKYKRDFFRLISIDKSKTEVSEYNQDYEITSIEIAKQEEEQEIKDYLVTVNFEAIEVAKDGSKSSSNWQAKIILSFQSIKYNFQEKDFSPLNFKVKSYESKKLN
jgi:type IV secretory pathway component VirB8